MKRKPKPQIKPTQKFKLNTINVTRKGRPKFVSAASGLVEWQGQWVIVADDENHIAVFPKSDRAKRGTFYRIFSGHLPPTLKKRKKKKPDLESIAVLESGLLVVPSGSKENRGRGAFLEFRKHGLRIMKVDFSQIYQKLGRKFSELNIEGAIVCGDNLVVAQRGNGSLSQNALIYLNLRKINTAIMNGNPIPSSVLVKVKPIALPKMNKVPFSFTDLAVINDERRPRIFFVASAEASNSTYLDGQCLGSLIGELSSLGKILWTRSLYGKRKYEGCWVSRKGGNLYFHLVNDDDDPSLPAHFSRLKVRDVFADQAELGGRTSRRL